jgi:polyisoprenoid-binding protein YceI
MSDRARHRQGRAHSVGRFEARAELGRDMRLGATACAIALLAVAPPASSDPSESLLASEQIAPAATEAPAGGYTLDRSHASLIFRVNHLGFSRYTARFTRFDAELHFDPADPAASSVTATIDPSSIETDHPDPTYDFDAQLRTEPWLNTAQFPEMTFRSTRLELTGPHTARMIGELGLHGVTRPVTLDVTFNGGYAVHPLDPFGARIGFSAQGSLRRSEFGISEGIPPPGSNIGVGDNVEILIEAEFTRQAPAAVPLVR